jgi:hypothetical protein
MEPTVIDQFLTRIFGDQYGAWVALLVQIIGIASVLVRFTPTLKDDDALKGFVRFVGKYIALNRSSGTSTLPKQ